MFEKAIASTLLCSYTERLNAHLPAINAARSTCVPTANAAAHSRNTAEVIMWVITRVHHVSPTRREFKKEIDQTPYGTGGSVILLVDASGTHAVYTTPVPPLFKCVRGK